MAVRTRAAHTLADRDLCSMPSSAFVPSTADEVTTDTFAFSTLSSFLHLRFLFLLRTSVLTVINTTHRNHHQSTCRHTPGPQLTPLTSTITAITTHKEGRPQQGRKGKTGLITQSESSWQEVGPLDQRPNHRHMEWRRRRCRATSGPPMWSRSSVRRCESGGIPRIAPHSRRSESLRLHDRPGNGQRSPGDGPSASDERCSSTCRSQ